MPLSMNSQEIYFPLALFPVFFLFSYSGCYIFSFLLRMQLPFVRRTTKTRLKIEKKFSYFFIVAGFLSFLNSFLLSVWIGCSISLAICAAALVRLIMVKKEVKTISSSSVNELNL